MPLVMVTLAVQCGNATDLLGQGDLLTTDGASKAGSQFANIQMYADDIGGVVNNGEVVSTNVTVGNNTRSDVTHSFSVRAFLNSDTLPERYLKTYSFSSLLSGNFISLSAAITIPSNTAAGDYRIVIRADDDQLIQETNEADNIFTSSLFNVTPRPDLIDLLPNSVSANLSTGNVSFHIKNEGDADLNPELFYYKIYLSTNDTALDPADIMLYQSSSFNGSDYISLAQGAWVVMSINVPGLITTTPGEYTVLVEVDSGNDIPEKSEINNVNLHRQVIF